MELETEAPCCATPESRELARSLDGRAIDAFLACHRIALIGVSQRPDHFSRTLMRDLRSHGLQVVPVNPAMTELEGEPVFPSVAAIQPPVEGAYLATPRGATEAVLRECHEAGVTRVWLHKGGVGEGAASDAAVEFGRGQGMELVAGQCILMFLHPVKWTHKLHRELKKAAGTLPT
jgi:predicted CoA-binding protein